MSDIVKRLRQPAVFAEPAESQRLELLAAQAADEIERLTRRVEELERLSKKAADWEQAYSTAAKQLCECAGWHAEAAAENERMQEALVILSDHWKHGYGGSTRADVIRAVEDIARAAITKGESRD